VELLKNGDEPIIIGLRDIITRLKKINFELNKNFSTARLFYCYFNEKACGKHIYFNEKRYHVAIMLGVIYN